MKSQHSLLARDKLDRLSGIIPVMLLPIECGIHYGRVRSELERAGTPIGNNDIWIAAHALSLGVTLITNNVGEFERVAGLGIENWVS